MNGVSVLTRRQHVPQLARRRAKHASRPATTSILVRFASPIAKVKPAYDKLGYKLPAANDQAKEMVSMWARKAPYHYGWDWGPRFVTSGIWRPVALEAWDAARARRRPGLPEQAGRASAAELGVVGARRRRPRRPRARHGRARRAGRRWATPTSR